MLSRRRALGLGATALGAVAGGSLLSACGGRGSDSRTLKFWQFYAPYPADLPVTKKQSQWFVDLVDAWNREHDPKVELVFIALAEYLNGAKLPTAFAADEGPDIFIVSPGDFLRYYNGGVLQDLTPHLSRQVIADFQPGTLESRTVDGRVYGLPMEVEPMAMFYSKPAFEAAKLSEADIPRTWDQLLDVGDKLRSAGQPGVVFETQPGYFQNFTWYPFMWSAGGEVMNPAGTASTFDSPGAIKALSLWQQAIQSGISPRTLPAAGDASVAFTQNLVSMWHRGIWTIKEFQENSPDVRYGVFRTPIPDGGTYTTSLGGWAFVANSRGRNPEAAAEFCAFALGSERPDSVARMTDWCAGVKTDIPPRKSSLDQAVARGAFNNGPMRVFLDEVFPGSRGEPRYPPVIYKAISDAIQACMFAGADPHAQAATVAESIDAYLKTYQGAKLS